MKHIHNLRPLALAFILVVTGIAAAVCGLVMKGQLQNMWEATTTNGPWRCRF